MKKKNDDTNFNVFKFGFGCRMLRVVLILAIVIVLSLSFGIWINVDGAYGGKTVMKKLNIISPDQENSILDEHYNYHAPSATYSVTEEDEIPALLDKLDIAHYFTYLPDGYELIQANYMGFEDIPYEDDSAELDYRYYKTGEKFLDINFSYMDYIELSAEEISDYGYVGYTSPITGQELLITEKMNDSNFEYQIRWSFREGICTIYGYDSIEEGIKIAESIYRHK